MLGEKSILFPHPICLFNIWADAITSTSGKRDSFEMMLAIGLNESLLAVNILMDSETG